MEHRGATRVRSERVRSELDPPNSSYPHREEQHIRCHFERGITVTEGPSKALSKIVPRMNSRLRRAVTVLLLIAGSVPLVVGSAPAASANAAGAVASGGNHSCAVTASGGVKCWGLNFVGELGNDVVR